MNVLLKKLKFNQFDVFPELVHSISPRCFENDLGEMEEFSFRKNNKTEEANFHIKEFLKSIGIRNPHLFFVNQVHSDKVFILDDANLASSETQKITADALLTNIPGKPIGVFTADCLPILVYDPRLKVIGAIHAGRRGSEQNIIFKVVREMRDVYGSRPEELMAGFGPAIGGCCYEVDEDCVLPFEKMFPSEKNWFRYGLPGKCYLDLLAINKIEAEKAGLLKENIFSLDHCTCCSPQSLFSYRREGKTGRILTIIMLRQEENF